MSDNREADRRVGLEDWVYGRSRTWINRADPGRASQFDGRQVVGLHPPTILHQRQAVIAIFHAARARAWEPAGNSPARRSAQLSLAGREVLLDVHALAAVREALRSLSRIVGKPVPRTASRDAFRD